MYIMAVSLGLLACTLTFNKKREGDGGRETEGGRRKGEEKEREGGRERRQKEEE